MKAVKRKTVINAETAQIERVEELVAAGRYRTVSEFVREAVHEKLQRIEQDRIAEAVERYCAAGHADEDGDLVGAQAFSPGQLPGRPGRRRGATR